MLDLDSLQYNQELLMELVMLVSTFSDELKSACEKGSPSGSNKGIDFLNTVLVLKRSRASYDDETRARNLMNETATLFNQLLNFDFEYLKFVLCPLYLKFLDEPLLDPQDKPFSVAEYFEGILPDMLYDDLEIEKLSKNMEIFAQECNKIVNHNMMTDKFLSTEIKKYIVLSDVEQNIPIGLVKKLMPINYMFKINDLIEIIDLIVT